jgi:hypothetical protein
MDPVEEALLQLFADRKKVAEKIVASRGVQEETENIEDFVSETIQDRLPYSISKTVQYLKADEYQRRQKALKKQKETI